MKPSKDAIERYQEIFLHYARPNEPVLLVTKRYEFLGCGGMGYRPQPRDYTLQTQIRFGVLVAQEPLSIIDNGNLSVLVQFRVERERSQWVKMEGPIRIGGWDTFGRDPDVPLYSRDEHDAYLQKENEKHGLRKTDFPLEVVVGSAAIQQYCLERYHISDCLAAFHLLGLSEGLTSEFRTRDLEIRTKILEELESLLARETKIMLEIERIFASTRRGVYRTLSGVTVCESEDDARIISAGSRDLLKRIQGEMRNLLRRALELGMDQMPWVRTFQDRPGLSLDVPQYIQALYERLEAGRS
ncbi:MAG: hypothetical protein HY617_03010 [Candidatus Sungbacteria bacterium]|nr:hypothetical protein [Candidatus Sungbacteria bacterium]